MTKTTAAIVYARISKDDSGDGLGVARQEKDGRALCQRRGWSVADVIVDNDLSAFSGKVRPGYDRMLEAIKAGRASAIVAWHNDRLHRSPRELEDFIDVIEATGAKVVTCTAGDYDLATPEGRYFARSLGNVARMESEHKSRRLRRKHEEIAERGRWKGGRRPYGYRPVGDGALEVVDAEAEVLRDSARRLLGGESLFAICEELNARKVPTVSGVPWRAVGLRGTLLSPTTAGQRAHRGEVVGRASWDPILDPGTARRLRRLLTDPARHSERPRRSYLLTGGLAICGRCGGRLASQRRRSGAPAYICMRRPGENGCGRLLVHAQGLEDLVSEDVMVALDGPTLARAVDQSTNDADDDEAERELLEVGEGMDELATMFGAGNINRAEWLKARSTFEARQKAAQAVLGRRRTTTALDRFAGSAGALRQAWPDMSLDQRRAIVAAVIKQVVVAPATRRGPVFDERRISYTWNA